MNIKAITLNNVKLPNGSTQQIAFRGQNTKNDSKNQDNIEFKNNFDGNPIAVKPSTLEKIVERIEAFIHLDPSVATFNALNANPDRLINILA